MELEEGVSSDELLAWVKEESPAFDWKNFGFQEFSEFLNYAQDKTVVRIVPDEDQRAHCVPRRGVPPARRARAGAAAAARRDGRNRGAPAGSPRTTYGRFSPGQKRREEGRRRPGCQRQRSRSAKAGPKDIRDAAQTQGRRARRVDAKGRTGGSACRLFIESTGQTACPTFAP